MKAAERGASGTRAALGALAAGVLFGAGLVVSGMTLPSKVIGFLDVTGRWDASLALVMVGAIGVHAVLYRLIRRRSSPLFDVRFHVPTRSDLDGKLVAGAALFGVGWGLGGFCPGPGLVSLAAGHGGAVVFVAAMVLGMLLQHAIDHQSKRSREPSASAGGSEPDTAPAKG
jgi:uncharacterized membrane protein YedE/YeeE